MVSLYVRSQFFAGAKNYAIAYQVNFLKKTLREEDYEASENEGGRYL